MINCRAKIVSVSGLIAVWLIILFIIKLAFTEVKSVVLVFVFLGLLIILIVVFRILRIRKFNILIYSSILILVILIPIIFISDQNVASLVCKVQGANQFTDLPSIPINSNVRVCGIIRDCVSTPVGSNQHYWEVCLLEDPSNEGASLLFYNLDLTASEDIPYEWFSMSKYDKGTLVVRNARLDQYLDSGNCNILELCDNSNMPLVQVYLHD